MISDALRTKAVDLGVDVTYEDVDQVVHDADEAVVAHVVDVLDANRREHPDGLVPPVHLDPARPVAIRPAGAPGRSGASGPTDAELVVDGTMIRPTIDGDSIVLPIGLPSGCHELRVEAGTEIGECVVVVAPEAMPGLDPTRRSSALFVPTYALWERDAPLPSFAHLADLATRVADFDVDLVATLPLYAAFLDEPFDPSPYSPVSRLHWNEVYLDDRDLPAAPVPELGGEVDWRTLAARRRTQLVVAARDADDATIAELDRFVAAHPDVGSFARFMAARESSGDLVVERSHVLAQYLADRQLAAIGAGPDGDDGAADAPSVALSLDLPIGSHPAGWETWAYPGLFAESMSVGAPPDTFFTEGQNWGFPPQLPTSMRAGGYRLWRQMVARAGRHCDLLRIDHVMAVHRLWWIPDGQRADRGVYVRYPHDELLAVIAAEAAAAGVGIVGENLGTVPPEVDAALDAWQVLGMYEEQFHLDDESPEIPARSIAGVRTHDMAPYATVELDGGDPPPLDAVLERLAVSDAQFVIADLDDLIDETRPHNLPGRVVPGIWRRRLDRPTSETLADERVRRRLELLRRSSP